MCVADLFSGGANTNYEVLYEGKALDSIKSTLILPEVLDESKWYEGRHRYTDPEQRHVLIYIANPSSSGFYYNTNLVNPKEFKSYWDLVAPKWKGKYVSQDPSEHGPGRFAAVLLLSSRAGRRIYQQLFGDMQPSLAVTGGRSPIGWRRDDMPCASVAAIRPGPRRQGLPVDELDNVDWKEGVQLTSGGGSMSFIKGAPNPNAAKVFVNWFLSRRGQIALQKYQDLYGEDAPNSRRIDIPKDVLVPVNRMQAGKRYFDVSDPKYADMTPMFDLLKQIVKVKEGK